MKNFIYDGSYPGYVDGHWIVDERDGHIWLNVPGHALLQSFPKTMTLVFLETPKEYGTPNLSIADEVMRIEDFKFDQVLARKKPISGSSDYYEVIVGKEIVLTLPDHVIPGINIGSIALIDKEINQIVSVINLRDTISMSWQRTIEFKFAIAIRTATYGLVSYPDVDFGNGIKASLDVFFIDAPINEFNEGRVKYSSPTDYTNFLSTLTNNDEWFSRYSEIPTYSAISLLGPTYKLLKGNDNLTSINLQGELTSVSGFTGVKSICIPFCPGISAVIRFNSFSNPSGHFTYMTFDDKTQINFNILLGLIEVPR